MNAAAEGVKKFATGAEYSGEFGEGVVAHYADIKVPTLIYGSQAEYNTNGGLFWPYYPSQFAQVGAGSKELYVDNYTEKGVLYSHVWLTNVESIKKYCDGKPREAVCSFFRRRLVGSTEAPMERPANAKEWEIVDTKAEVVA